VFGKTIDIRFTIVSQKLPFYCYNGENCRNINRHTRQKTTALNNLNADTHRRRRIILLGNGNDNLNVILLLHALLTMRI